MEKTAKATKTLSRQEILSITICAMSIALTYIATAFINIRLPIQANGGLIHLGNAALFIVAVVFGKKTGAIAGGIGMALFDLTSGWVMWAGFTLVVVALMGFVAGWITEKKKNIGFIILAILAALVIKIVGYYIAEGIIYGNWVVPVASIPGNIIQVVVGGIIAIPVALPLSRVSKKLTNQN